MRTGTPSRLLIFDLYLTRYIRDPPRYRVATGRALYRPRQRQGDPGRGRQRPRHRIDAAQALAAQASMSIVNVRASDGWQVIE